jgi:energy-coupling factor transporter ATP-binding protein EcfA2
MQNEKTNKPRLVSIYGAKGSGKSTLATILCGTRVSFSNGEMHFPVIRISFADVLRNMLRAAGIPEKYLTTMKEVPIPGIPGNPTGRYLLQTLGTDWGRENVDPDIWAYLASLRIAETLERGVDVVIDDMRFPNEVEVVKRLGGVLIRIDRPDLVVHTDPHVSESHWVAFKPDLVLVNDGSPEDLLADYTLAIRTFYPYGT